MHFRPKNVKYKFQKPELKIHPTCKPKMLQLFSEYFKINCDNSELEGRILNFELV